MRSTSGDFAVIQSLSLKDKTLAKSMPLADGVEVRLKDTDADLFADFDLLNCDARARFPQDMQAGRHDFGANSVALSDCDRYNLRCHRSHSY